LTNSTLNSISIANVASILKDLHLYQCPSRTGK